MSFNTLSELRKQRGNFDNLMKEVEKISNPQSFKKGDEREWKPTVDKAGNGYAVIRFLPAPQGEDMPWVRMWNHGFQDPVSELNSELWNSGVEANKDIARKQKRRLNYYANILVVEDSSNPETVGNVYYYKFGKKIFDKIKDVMQPQFEDEKPVNPFDFWEGANFKLKIRQVEGYRNYDKSEFDNSSPIDGSDEKIEEIWGKQHSLQEKVGPGEFKTYEELKAKLDLVLSGGPKVATAEQISQTTNDAADDHFIEKVKSVQAAPEPSTTDDEDETLSYFKSLAED